jgi:dihydroxyacetone kinase phosphotransfer subunit
MVGVVLVSHSHLLAQGLCDFVSQVARGRVNIAPAGGVDETTLGTSAERIKQAIETVYSPDGVLVLIDLGSALLSVETAITEMLPAEMRPHVKLSNAPLVEGAYVAVVQASLELGENLEELNAIAEAAKDMQKIH